MRWGCCPNAQHTRLQSFSLSSSPAVPRCPPMPARPCCASIQRAPGSRPAVVRSWPGAIHARRHRFVIGQRRDVVLSTAHPGVVIDVALNVVLTRAIFRSLIICRSEAAMDRLVNQEIGMNVHLVRTAIALAALCATLPSAAHDTDSTAGQLGKVHFKVCCNAAAQREFDLAMAYYHSFAWEQIKAPLDRALQADSACGMAHWAACAGLARQPLRLARQRVGQDAGRRCCPGRAGAQVGAGHPARARLCRCAGGLLPGRRQAQPPHPCQVAWNRGSRSVATKYPEDTRGDHPLRPGAVRQLRPGRQAVQQPVARRQAAGAGLREATRASRAPRTT